MLETVAPMGWRGRIQDFVLLGMTSLALGLFAACALAPMVGRLVGGWIWLRADRGIRKEDERFAREYRTLVESTMKYLEAPANQRPG